MKKKAYAKWALIASMLGLLVSIAVLYCSGPIPPPCYQWEANEQMAIANLCAVRGSLEYYRSIQTSSPSIWDNETLVRWLKTQGANVDTTYQGYLFKMSRLPERVEIPFIVKGFPVEPGISGQRKFLLDQHGEIRYSFESEVLPDSPIIGTGSTQQFYPELVSFISLVCILGFAFSAILFSAILLLGARRRRATTTAQ